MFVMGLFKSFNMKKKWKETKDNFSLLFSFSESEKCWISKTRDRKKLSKKRKFDKIPSFIVNLEKNKNVNNIL